MRFDGAWQICEDGIIRPVISAQARTNDGQYITNLFAVIVDRPQDVVCLLGSNHRYSIAQV